MRQRESVHALLSELKSCSATRDLEWGKRIHAKAVESRDDWSVHVVTALIRMYAKCGSMAHAHRVFERIPNPSVASWNALLLGYAENGDGAASLEWFSRMKECRCTPSCVTYIAALKACTTLAVNGDGSRKRDYLHRGREIHVEAGRHLNLYVQNTLIDMYAKCGSMESARGVFDSIDRPDVVSWNALLLGYVENGEGHVALDLFLNMKAYGCVPNSVTYVAALKACTSLVTSGDCSAKRGCLERGRQIHLEVGCHLNHYVQSSLIDMYANCGSMTDARLVFDSIQKPDVVSWNALLLGYTQNGEGRATLYLFSEMKRRGCAPNSVTFVAALKACTSLAESGDGSASLERGRQVHSEVGIHLDGHVQGTLIDMYGKCGSMVDAHCVFDSIQEPDVVCWTALLLGYAECGEGHVALDLFVRMKAAACQPNSLTYLAALKACAALAGNGDGRRKADCLERGRAIHSQMGCHFDDHYVHSMLIDMYAKSGSMVEARRVFESIQDPGAVSWCALLLGYAVNGDGVTALDLFSRMKARGCPPTSVAYLAAFKACSSIGDLARGREIHSEVLDFTPHLLTSLVDFYAKCGSMGEARKVFDLHSRSVCVPAWNALLAGYSSFGDVDSVFNLFEAMGDKGFRPDAVTFVCLLLCCSHAGLVERAREYFEAMPVQYGVIPTIVHYTCMIDVLGRANRLKDAIAVLQRMPCSPNAVIWRVLLGACCKWKNLEVGRLAFHSLLDLDEKDASAYVLMAQIYGTAGMLEEQERVLAMRNKCGALEEAWPGCGYAMDDEVGKILNSVSCTKRSIPHRGAAEPEFVHHHVEGIKGDRRGMPLEMPLGLQ